MWNWVFHQTPLNDTTTMCRIGGYHTNKCIYKIFMGTKPPQLNGHKEANGAKQWLQEMINAFEAIELPRRLRVKYEPYMVMSDAEAW